MIEKCKGRSLKIKTIKTHLNVIKTGTASLVPFPSSITWFLYPFAGHSKKLRAGKKTMSSYYVPKYK